MVRLIGSLLVLAVVFVAALLLWRAAGTGDPGGPSRQWFFDPATGELFAGPMLATAPITAPSDKPGERSGVLAVVVRQPAGGTAIAYLVSNERPAGAGSAASGTDEAWYSAPGSKRWVSSRDPRSAEITARTRTLAAGGPVVLDFPAEP